MARGTITVLAENTAGGRGLLGEHGLSFWIEWDGKRILFDTGQGHVLLKNARQLGVDLRETDALALSHGHYDHTGGLRDALLHGPATTVYVHPAAFAAKYARNPDGSARSVAIPDLDEAALSELAEIHHVEGPTEIFNGLCLTGPVPRKTGFEDVGGDFFLDEECTEPDPIVDDQAAFVETPAGTIVILGCAHAGVINTLRYVQELTDGRGIHTVLGGMHLRHAGPERMDKTVDELRRLDVQRLLPCHCTGMAAVARLWQEFPGRCASCPVGSVVDIP